MESAERARRSARAPAGGNVGSDNVRVRSGWPQTLVSSDLDMSQERNGLIIIPDAGWRGTIRFYPSSSSSVHQLVVPTEEIASKKVTSVYQKFRNLASLAHREIHVNAA